MEGCCKKLPYKAQNPAPIHGYVAYPYAGGLGVCSKSSYLNPSRWLEPWTVGEGAIPPYGWEDRLALYPHPIGEGKTDRSSCAASPSY